jgi:hypothetical protein
VSSLPERSRSRLWTDYKRPTLGRLFDAERFVSR